MARQRGNDKATLGKAGKDRQGSAGRGGARTARSGRHGNVRSGLVWPGRQRMATHGEATLDMAGNAWRRESWHCLARHGAAGAAPS